MPDLLLELCSEEIPARMQRDAAEGLKSALCRKLSEYGVKGSEALAYATPRRVCIAIKDLPKSSPEQKTERRGPREGAPSEAISGFLRSAGATIEDLELREDKKGRYYFAATAIPGQPLSEILPEAIEYTIRSFVWPKSMVWGASELRWVRPLHSILCLLVDKATSKIINFEIEGIHSGDATRGHRFMSPLEFSVLSFADYKKKLEKSFVILDSKDRIERIRSASERLAAEHGLELVGDPELLDENAGLTEWPVPMIGAISERFLDIPNELLTASMKQHQKYFSAVSPSTGKVSHFVMVANREAKDNGKAMLAGNLRVLNSRLEDADFHWKNDARSVEIDGLGALAGNLGRMQFHNKLGSMQQRALRISAIAEKLAGTVGADAAEARRAAELSKIDLTADTVKEFPELQGKIGRRLALLGGEKASIADACEQHYLPSGPKDPLPQEPLAIVVGLADRIDYLAGFFGIGEIYSGSKDPHGLRRAALGVIRLVLGNEIRLGLLDVLDFAFKQYSSTAAVAENIKDTKKYSKVKVDLLEFIHERLLVNLRSSGLRQDCIEACIAVSGDNSLDLWRARGSDDLTLAMQKATQIEQFVESEKGLNFLNAFKRVHNILASEERKGSNDLNMVPESRLFEDARIEGKLLALAESVKKKIMENSIVIPFSDLKNLGLAINDFLDHVHVYVKDNDVCRNRLRLLGYVRGACAEIADFRKIEA